MIKSGTTPSTINSFQNKLRILDEEKRLLAMKLDLCENILCFLLSCTMDHQFKLGDKIKNPVYDKYYNDSIENPYAFFDKISNIIHWEKPYTKIYDPILGPLGQWYVGGKLNAAYNCLEKQISQGLGDHIAFYYYCQYEEKTVGYTYQQCYDISSRISYYLKNNLQLQENDVAIQYLPKIPESIFLQLALARIGVINHFISITYPKEEVHRRIIQLNAKCFFTTDVVYKSFDEIVNYQKIMDDFFKDNDIDSIHQFHKVLVPRCSSSSLQLEKWVNINEMISCESTQEPLFVDSSHPLYILNTSGSTGVPKYIQNSHLSPSFSGFYQELVKGCKKDDVILAVPSSLGWIGHEIFLSLSCMSRGGTFIQFEGNLLAPDPTIFWKIIQDFKVTLAQCVTTVLYSIQCQDPDGTEVAKFDFSSLKTLIFGGETYNDNIFKWLSKYIPQNINIADIYGQTETAYTNISNILNNELFGSPFVNNYPTHYRAIPGFNMKIIDDEGKEINEPGVTGRLMIKLPLPPVSMNTIYQDDEAVKTKYLSVPGYFDSGDIAYKDCNEFFYVRGRSDSEIKHKNHRILTTEVENALLCQVSELSEVILIKPDDYSQISAFIVLKKQNSPIQSRQEFEKKIIEVVKETTFGLVDQLNLIYLDELPRGATSKVNRLKLKQMVNEIQSSD
ncbi:acetyl-synthetase [Stylonychia lemnae]|uniref:Acetyl-synthetase n=1 Tax=Stylonychia lemnae TaxID=5949 RepID=A0A078B5J9_STYLE|nr:acetyl-synthetase [Stylonychia lemnae]|eukprot:CDW89800.1 acetyl-synthetase [Stylonychia lemnae]